MIEEENIGDNDCYLIFGKIIKGGFGKWLLSIFFRYYIFGVCDEFLEKKISDRVRNSN